jgi:hypothetical protein
VEISVIRRGYGHVDKLTLHTQIIRKYCHRVHANKASCRSAEYIVILSFPSCMLLLIQFTSPSSLAAEERCETLRSQGNKTSNVKRNKTRINIHKKNGFRASESNGQGI